MKAYRILFVLLVVLALLGSIVHAQMGTATGYFVVIDSSNATAGDNAKATNQAENEVSNSTSSPAGASSITGAVVGPSQEKTGEFWGFRLVKWVFSSIASWFS